MSGVVPGADGDTNSGATATAKGEPQSPQTPQCGRRGSHGGGGCPPGKRTHLAEADAADALVALAQHAHRALRLAPRRHRLAPREPPKFARDGVRVLGASCGGEPWGISQGRSTQPRVPPAWT